MEHGVLAGEIFGVIFGRERNVDVALVARLHAHDLLFEAGNEATAAKFERLIFRGAAIESDAVDSAGIVEHDRVAVFGLAIDLDKAGLTLARHGDLRIHHGLGNSIRGTGNFYTFIVAELHLGLDVNGRGENETVLVDADDIHGGIVHGLDAVLFDGGFIRVVVDRVDRVAVENLFAVILLDHTAGGFALAETGNGNAATVFQISLLNSLLERIGVDADRQFNLILFPFFDR